MTRRPTSIDLLLDPNDLRRWHALPITHPVVAPGLDLRIRRAPRRTRAPAGSDLLFALERLLARGLGETAVDRLEAATLSRFASAERTADLTIDLLGEEVVTPDRPTITLRCDGGPVVDGALAAVLDGRTPILTAEFTAPGRNHAIARWPVAVEDRRSALRSVSLVAGRAAHLVALLIAEIADGGDPAGLDLHRAEGEAGEGAPATRRAPLGFFLAAFADRVAGRLARLVGREAPTWATAWRFRDAVSPDDRFDLDRTPFLRLPDDGARFFADPFPFVADGRLHLLVEEFPFATGKGLISLTTLGDDGRFGPVRPVIETDCHLSYPFVFDWNGRTWMVPETSGRRTVELWANDGAPDRWRLDRVLLADVDVGDATLAEIDGRWWLFGATRAPFTSSWEALSLWSAPSPLGPWVAHRPDPVRVDVRSTRPAGHLFRTAEGLFRPVQDSSRGYGSGLAVTRIEAIGEGGFRESLHRRFATPAPLSGLHTWNRLAHAGRRFEVIDMHVAPSAFGVQRILAP